MGYDYLLLNEGFPLEPTLIIISDSAKGGDTFFWRQSRPSGWAALAGQLMTVFRHPFIRPRPSCGHVSVNRESRARQRDFVASEFIFFLFMCIMYTIHRWSIFYWNVLVNSTNVLSIAQTRMSMKVQTKVGRWFRKTYQMVTPVDLNINISKMGTRSGKERITPPLRQIWSEDMGQSGV